MLNYDFLYKNLEELHESFLLSATSTTDILEKAIEIEKFIVQLFELETKHNNPYNELLRFKRRFIQRYALKKFPNQVTPVRNPIPGDDFVFMQTVLKWEEEGKQDLIDQAAQYAAFAHHNNSMRMLFQNPKTNTLHNVIRDEHLIHSDVFFSSTAFPLTNAQAYDQATYCIKCHKQNKDSCSKGFKDLEGCPLDQKISEMMWLKERGYDIAALAVVTLDNPLAALTGHRICNDCRLSCIYQKQTPVDVPGVETQILKAVLDLPYGFEIYSLLMRWNPLRASDFYPKTPTQKNILVAGLGPSGIAFSYYMLMQGHTVLAIEGMSIPDWSFEEELIYDVNDVYALPRGGFGGVCEYGITKRWDKRLLNVVRLILERFDRFYLKGNTRLGSQITLSETKKFDHTALCLGAGRPKLLDIPNMLAPGVFMASDFLMRAHSKQPIPVGKGPVIVIGGGLTAIDVCLEATAFSDNVTLVYRGALEEAPSYQLNLEEVQNALSSNIHIIECARPVKINLDHKGYTCGLFIERQDQTSCLKAETIIIAVGTLPYQTEDLSFHFDELHDEFFINTHISILGDMNPHYKGSVVKALQSAKECAKKIETHLL